MENWWALAAASTGVRVGSQLARVVEAILALVPNVNTARNGPLPVSRGRATRATGGFHPPAPLGWRRGHRWLPFYVADRGVAGPLRAGWTSRRG